MRISARKIVMSGILGAVSIMLGATGLGFIPVPTPAGHATIMHVPVILGAILEGPTVGLLTGLIFGLFSFLRATNPLFADPLVAILPRLIVGLTPYYAYRAFNGRAEHISLPLAGIIGSLTNTVFVLGIATLRGYLPPLAALGTAGLHGLPEAVIAAVLVAAIVKGVSISRLKRSL